MVLPGRTALHHAVFVVAVTAMALLLSLLLRPLLEPNYFALFLAAVFLSAWHYGWVGGLLATAASTAAVTYFFLTPGFQLAGAGLNALVRSVLFVVTAVLITGLTASWRSSRRLLAATLSSIGEGVVATDREGRITFLNPAAQALTGWKEREARGKRLGEVLRLIDEASRQSVEDPVEKALRAGPVTAAADHTMLVSREGPEIPIEHSAAPVRDQNGELRGTILVFRDVTARRQLEAQLSHSQKLDAIGRLAGEVAGDFNNVLTVITGYSELLHAELPAHDSRRGFAEEVMYAAERAAALTRHLLAFSRGPSAQARALDLNAVINRMEPMLRRLIGENTELIILGGPQLGRVSADPNQIEQVLMHLVTNARDAMPDGGKLVIETANVDLDDASGKKVGVRPGACVMLAVSDTGVGMDAETRSHLFEPFFTTKQPRKGSGLGLSTVYGIVKQSEGGVTVYSQPGCGTIFEIYLPRAKEAVAPPARARGGSAKGSETILLVDDEEGVRKLVCAVLRSNGYDVIEAGNGAAALSAWEKNAHKIDLVLTDVVMPQMDGFALGQRLRGHREDIPILYMSGYRDSPIGPAQPGEVGRAFLHKPFTSDALLAKVREVLDVRA